MPLPLLERVVISNFRSIADCDVSLGPLTFLVGLNGAGKSNFIDGLRFSRDALRGTLEQAFSLRRSNLGMLTHSSISQNGFRLAFHLKLSSGGKASYSFELAPQAPRGFRVTKETCFADADSEHFFVVDDGILSSSSIWKDVRPALLDDRLFLVQASGNPAFRAVYEALANMEFYIPEPALMKTNFDTTGPGDILESDGINAVNILERLSSENPAIRTRVVDYMKRILPGLEDIEVGNLRDTYRYLLFKQEPDREFFPESMSDGTLRALAVLIAVFQRTNNESRPTLVAIEEPETGLHPAALGILLSALQEASENVQVLVTSHSTDLLDSDELNPESIRAVESIAGATSIGFIDEIGRGALQNRLFSAGELMRMDQLRPNPGSAPVPGRGSESTGS